MIGDKYKVSEVEPGSWRLDAAGNQEATWEADQEIKNLGACAVLRVRDAGGGCIAMLVFPVGDLTPPAPKPHAKQPKPEQE